MAAYVFTTQATSATTLKHSSNDSPIFFFHDNFVCSISIAGKIVRNASVVQLIEPAKYPSFVWIAGSQHLVGISLYLEGVQ